MIVSAHRTAALPPIPAWRRAILAALHVRVTYTDTALRLLGSPCILTCNHESMIDGIAIALAAPAPLVYAVTPDYAVRNRKTAALLAYLARRGLGKVVPLNQANPAPLRHLLRALRNGHSVMIFPTGTIRAGAPELTGHRWLADRTGCDIVSASISGSGSSRLFGRKEGETFLRPRIDLTI